MYTYMCINVCAHLWCARACMYVCVEYLCLSTQLMCFCSGAFIARINIRASIQTPSHTRSTSNRLATVEYTLAVVY